MTLIATPFLIPILFLLFGIFFESINNKSYQKILKYYFYSGDNVTELRVKFLKKIEDTVPPGDD